jgi:GNAT superfamily N-acetyltransferase
MVYSTGCILDAVVTIREAVKEDVSSIVNLWIETVDATMSLGPYYTRSNEGHNTFAEFITGNLNYERAIVVVAEENNRIIGYCCAIRLERPPIMVTRDYGVIYALSVDRNDRRRGVGTKLYRKVRKWFLERGIKHIELNVFMPHLAGRDFCRNIGLKLATELYYQDL